MNASLRSRCRRAVERLSVVVFLTSLLVGTLPAEERAPSNTKAPAADRSSMVAVLDWEAVEKRIAENKGRIVVVDIWTTTCATCVAEFPEFVSLRKKFPADKVHLLTVACDYDGIREKPPQYYRPKVETFLREQKAESLDNVLLSVPFVDFLEQRNLRSTPAVLIYSADGKLARRFDNDQAKKAEDEFTMADVARFIEKRLETTGDVRP